MDDIQRFAMTDMQLIGLGREASTAAGGVPALSAGLAAQRDAGYELQMTIQYTGGLTWIFKRVKP